MAKSGWSNSGRFPAPGAKRNCARWNGIEDDDLTEAFVRDGATVSALAKYHERTHTLQLKCGFLLWG